VVEAGDEEGERVGVGYDSQQGQAGEVSEGDHTRPLTTTLSPCTNAGTLVLG
jgi:hypothetical protein